MDHTREPAASARRPRYRPPLGMPLSRPPRWSGLAAALLHGFLLMLLISPALVAVSIPDAEQGAGGPGPAGGGGGGTRGSGGGERVVERLQYIDVRPPAPQPELVPPDEQVQPEVPPPVEEETRPVDQMVELDIKMPTTKLDLALTAGIGGGTGNDGTSGSGPGRGGGVGSGVGTGRGSGEGPGTGGGEGEIYPPTPDFLTMPPMPKPRGVHGQVVQLKFQVDVDGSILGFEFTPTSDSNYNRRIREQFKDVRFRPAVRWDGQPVIATALVTLRL